MQSAFENALLIGSYLLTAGAFRGEDLVVILLARSSCSASHAIIRRSRFQCSARSKQVHSRRNLLVTVIPIPSPFNLRYQPECGVSCASLFKRG